MGTFMEIEKQGVGNIFSIDKVLYSGKSEFQNIDVFENKFFGKMLVLDGNLQSSERFEYIYNEMIVHMAMFPHPNPSKVLIVGGGSGNTVRQVLKYSSIEKVVLCEIDPLVTEVCKKYIPSFTDGLSDERVEVIHKDAYEYLKSIFMYKDSGFDVIIVDSSDPIGAAEILYSENFYDECLRVLNKNGRICYNTSCPIYYPEVFSKMYDILTEADMHVFPFYAATPEFPGGMFTFMLVQEKERLMLRYKDIKGLKYFNKEVFKGCTQLPNLLVELLKGE